MTTLLTGERLPPPSRRRPWEGLTQRLARAVDAGVIDIQDGARSAPPCTCDACLRVERDVFAMFRDPETREEAERLCELVPAFGFHVGRLLLLAECPASPETVQAHAVEVDHARTLHDELGQTLAASVRRQVLRELRRGSVGCDEP
jgi:hypothetical protein